MEHNRLFKEKNLNFDAFFINLFQNMIDLGIIYMSDKSYGD